MLAAELGERQITSNALAPGWTVTDQSAEFLGDETNQQEIAAFTALRRLGRPDDVAAVTAFLASDDGRWVTTRYPRCRRSPAPLTHPLVWSIAQAAADEIGYRIL
jgi:NAD(P)-dependent dehydrogenase (short-subunit alcohol dehydrogenase family)